MKKELIFDMDGTIADLYGVPDWLEKLRSYDVSPYEQAKPMYDMDTMNALLEILRGFGFEIVVASWASMECTREYSREIKKAKKKWLKRFGFPYDKLHVIKYGTQKANYIEGDLSILFDDSLEVRERFFNSRRGKYKRVVDVNKVNIIKYLADLVAEEIEERGL